MSRIKTLQSLFKRYRRPGDVVFAWIALLAALLLLSQIVAQTAWRPGGKLFAQPRFWPAVSLGGMAVFAALHLASALMSERIGGRWREVLLWLSALEFAGWFILYALIVPLAGYLPSTLVFALLLALRMGYRRPATLGLAVFSGLVIVVLFKSLLQVKLPAGQVYDALPDGLRQIMLTYF